MRDKCDVCHRYLISPCGPLSAEILLAGEFPGWEEVKHGTPFVGRTGDVLKEELARVGIQYQSCRMTNLWQHEMVKDCDINYHIRMLMADVSRAKYVLFMGSEITKTLMGTGIMGVSGLQVHSKYIPDGVVAYAAPNPASAFRGRIGEFRLSLQKFVSRVKEENDAAVSV